jgi:DNA polymerase III delta prime subunit
MEKKYFGKKNEDDRDKGVGGQNNGLNDGQSNRQEEQESINFDAVSLNFFGSSEPIIVFFGPPGVGKTVAFFRLMRRLEEEAGYKFTVSNATPDEGPFLAAKEAFRSSMATMDKETPPRTSNLDFLLVNASEHGSLKWHFLEAPGEHFFGATKPTDNRFKRYLSEVFATPNKKVYIFFFEHNMFGNPADRNKYAQRVANFINTRAKLGRDQFIILFNKINDHPQLFGGGEVNRTSSRTKFGSQEITAPYKTHCVTTVMPLGTFLRSLFTAVIFTRNTTPGRCPMRSTQTSYLLPLMKVCIVRQKNLKLPG